ncbi:MAG: hypothetical protein JRG73_18610 [Deltaproteobacteria bacterium]|nr:hypothetical protein [Deltaproteobacteria bacterium]
MTGAELVRMSLTTPDETGRRRPVPVEGTEFLEETERVIPGVGQRPEVSFLEDTVLSDRGTINCEGSGNVTGYEGVFAAGDAVSGPSTVVEAAASGKRAARHVRAYPEGVKREC